MGGTPGSPNGSNDLYVDDHDIGPVAQPFAVADPSGKTSGSQAYVLFSPDGKRFAYVKRVPGGMAAVVDGKVGRAYDSIGVFQFSPDSKHDFYVGTRNSQFVVFDGQEMEGEGTVKNFVFSQTGGRLAYLAYGPATGFHMVVDGKASPRFQEYVAHSMSFSEDGKHYAYAIHVNFSQCQIVRDGVATNVPSLVPFNTRTRSDVDFPPLFFSGDGTRLVWVWPIAGRRRQCDRHRRSGDCARPGNYEFPTFSPDSKRFATMIWLGMERYSLSVDGKTGPTYDDFLEVNPNVARFLDSHTFRFLGVKNGSVYRVTVNLGDRVRGWRACGEFKVATHFALQGQCRYSKGDESDARNESSSVLRAPVSLDVPSRLGGLHQAFHAQTRPRRGPPVVVRMWRPWIPAKDPAGKQYRASVTKAVEPATASPSRRAQSRPSRWRKADRAGPRARLRHVNGQAVAVTSGPASVTAGAQAAVSTVNSVLGGFGHHVNAPAGVTAVATGQRVVLPPGATLTFVLSQPPAASTVWRRSQPHLPAPDRLGGACAFGRRRSKCGRRVEFAGDESARIGGSFERQDRGDIAWAQQAGCDVCCESRWRALCSPRDAWKP